MHYATSWKVTGLIPEKITGFSYLPKPSSCTMALESTQPLTEMSTRNLPGGKDQPAHKADNLTAICEGSGIALLYFYCEDNHRNACKSSCKVSGIVSITKTGMCQQILIKLPNIKFHTNLFCGSSVVPCIQIGQY
jgi:hypothetical protein